MPDLKRPRLGLLRGFFERLVAAGRPRMQAVVGCIR
jgi:hypothetical protein